MLDLNFSRSTFYKKSKHSIYFVIILSSSKFFHPKYSIIVSRREILNIFIFCENFLPFFLPIFWCTRWHETWNYYTARFCYDFDDTARGKYLCSRALFIRRSIYKSVRFREYFFLFSRMQREFFAILFIYLFIYFSRKKNRLFGCVYYFFFPRLVCRKVLLLQKARNRKIFQKLQLLDSSLKHFFSSWQFFYVNLRIQI